MHCAQGPSDGTHVKQWEPLWDAHRIEEDVCIEVIAQGRTHRPSIVGSISGYGATMDLATRARVANLKADAKAKRDARMAVERKEAVKRKHESAAKFAKEVGAKFEHKPRSWERVPCNRSTVMVAKYTRRGTMDGVPKLIPVHDMRLGAPLGLLLTPCVAMAYTYFVYLQLYVYAARVACRRPDSGVAALRRPHPRT